MGFPRASAGAECLVLSSGSRYRGTGRHSFATPRRRSRWAILPYTRSPACGGALASMTGVALAGLDGIGFRGFA
eukprot:6807993-Alexandrium_andersonii.AAC.1